MSNGQLLIALLIALLGVLQAITLFILSDFRQRIMRVETMLMGQKQTGD